MHFLRTNHQIATFIALLFHVSGFIAIGIFNSQLFVKLTPVNLWISFLLLIWTQERVNGAFAFFLLICGTVGFMAEWVGVNTGYLFGNYSYGAVLGPQVGGVPLVIGANWFIVIYGIGVAMTMLQDKILSRSIEEPSPFLKRYLHFSLVFDGAALAVLLDWVIEPVAIKLGFWQWEQHKIPKSNYWTWFGISILLLILFRSLRFHKHNLFAVHLLLIQLMFFLLLRTFKQ